jgi:small subunit ribosomal protein S10
MAQDKIRVKIKAYDHRLIDQSCQQIIEAAIQTGAQVVGPVPLPTKKEFFTVGKSPFTDKDSREHFLIKTHKRIIDINKPTPKTIDSLMHMELPAGVDIQIGA